MNKKLTFRNKKMLLVKRYFHGPFFALCFYIALPALSERNMSAIFNFIEWSFSKGLLGVILFILPAVFIQIILGNLNTSQHVKLLILRENSILVILFGIFKEKLFRLNYSDISSLEWSKDGFNHFALNLKNGEQKLIRTEIYDREEAFEMIRKKIIESQYKEKS